MKELLKPMLATLKESPFNSKDWIFEIKWDGYRTLAVLENKKINLYSRNLHSYNYKFSTIHSELNNINQNAILDGEIVALSENGKSSFQRLQEYEKNPTIPLFYYVFDILSFKDKDIKNKPLIKRKEILQSIIPNNTNIKLSDYVEEKGVEFYLAAKKHKLEGIIAKKKNSFYKPGTRSKDWLKIKIIQEQEAIIIGFTEPKGGRKYIGSLLLGVYKDKRLIYIGSVGTGFDEQILSILFQKFKPLIQDNPSLKTIPNIPKKIFWLKPRIVCQVKFTEWTNEDYLRHAVFLGLREDKNPEEVTKEEVK